MSEKLSENYQTPTPEELRAYLRQVKMTGSEAARYTGVSPQTVRKWMTPEGRPSHRAIPWSAWAVLRIAVAFNTDAPEKLARTVRVVMRETQE